MNQSKKLLVLGIMFILFSVLTFKLNQWVSTQANSHSTDEVLLHQKKTTPIQKKRTRKPVKIDPLNDPLAPIVKSRNNTEKVNSPRKMDNRPIYERSEKTTILIQ